MGIQLYNTFNRKKEAFAPARDNLVRMYVCGPTVYNLIHLGNARPLVFFDTLRRYLEYRGHRVMYVQNFTDIDDKIIQRSQEVGEDAFTLGRHYIDEYFKDARALGVRPATIHPQVSQHMDIIISMLSDLVSKGYAYQVGANVYFSVSSFRGYGKLSGRLLSDLQAGARTDIDQRKRDPMDFALWKEAVPGEPCWDSPWGKGRPGWHSECAAMSLHYLGPEFDIHGGGADLIFPHHENEIAQAESWVDKKFARFWVHNGFITISEEKMSKSAGNFFLVRELLRQFPGAVLRFYLLSTHYRSPLDFSLDKVEEAMRGWERLRSFSEAMFNLDLPSDAPGQRDSDPLEAAAVEYEQNFIRAMDDDCNTALGIAALFEFARSANMLLKKPESLSQAGLIAARKVFQATAIDILGVISPESGKSTVNAGIEDAFGRLVELVLEIRRLSRERRDWAVADQIRQRMGEIGLAVEDTPEGTRWHYIRGEKEGSQ